MIISAERVMPPKIPKIAGIFGSCKISAMMQADHTPVPGSGMPTKNSSPRQPFSLRFWDFVRVFAQKPARCVDFFSLVTIFGSSQVKNSSGTMLPKTASRKAFCGDMPNAMPTGMARRSSVKGSSAMRNMRIWVGIFCQSEVIKFMISKVRTTVSWDIAKYIFDFGGLCVVFFGGWCFLPRLV